MKIIVGLLSVLVVVSIVSGCSKQEKSQKPAVSEQNTGPYAGWKTYYGKGIELIYPPGHPLEDKFHDIVRGYKTIRERACNYLGLPVSSDTLRVYYYTGYGQGREMTGHEYPFATKDAIHFWIPSFYGPSLMQYLIPKWVPEEPKYKFLKEGLIALLDFSGQNYHQMTLERIADKSFIPLKKLVVDTLVDSNKERLESAEAASFIDFLVYTYGMPKFKELYKSPEEFDNATMTVYGLPADSLETLWMNFMHKAVSMDTTKSSK